MRLAFRQASPVVRCSLNLRRDCRFHLQKTERSFWNNYFPNIRKPQGISLAEEKIYRLYNRFEEVSGFKEVRIAQEKVDEASDKLAALQDQRREATAKVEEVQSKLKEIYVELDKIKRGDDHYVRLITEENRLLKKEQIHQAVFKEVEKKERDQFTALVLAVKNSHEKERLQSKKTQYWSIIGSLCGALLGIIGTVITSHIRHYKLQELLSKSSNNDELKGQLETCTEITQDVGKQVTNMVSNIGQQVGDLLNNLNEKMTVKDMENKKLKYIIITGLVILLIKPLIEYSFNN